MGVSDLRSGEGCGIGDASRNGDGCTIGDALRERGTPSWAERRDGEWPRKKSAMGVCWGVANIEDELEESERDRGELSGRGSELHDADIIAARLCGFGSEA